MARSIEQDTLEFLQKEDERYRLRKLGFLKDIRKAAGEMASMYPPAEGETFRKWKSRCLKEFYRHNGFSSFCRSNILNPEFEAVTASLLRFHLHNLFLDSERTDTDRYLAPDSDTMSYALEPDLFQELYTLNFSQMPAFGDTGDLNSYCRDLARTNFPVGEPRIIQGMKDNKAFYWGKFYMKLKPIAAAYCYRMSGITSDSNIHDIWSDTCISVNRAVVGRRLQEPLDSKAIISYSAGILKNKNREIARNRAKAPEDIDLIQYRITAEDEEKFFNNPVTEPENFPSHIDKLSNYVDLTDKESVQGYFIVILYNKEHPFHAMLVEGCEDKVERMFEHYIDGLQYEEIVSRHYGITEGKSQKKECARLRQEIKRLKKLLYDRYMNMLDKYA